MALEITDNNFKEILAEGSPVVIDFWAPWCGPCKMVGPIIDELAKEYEGKVIMGKCDVDENSDLPAEFGIRNIPTVLFFKNGELVDKQVGAVGKLRNYYNILSLKIFVYGTGRRFFVK